MKYKNKLIQLVTLTVAVSVITFCINMFLGTKCTINSEQVEVDETLEAHITTEENIKDVIEEVHVSVESNNRQILNSHETFGTIANMFYTIDITYANIEDNSYIGNTATEKDYSGIIRFSLSDLANENIEEKPVVGNTYIVEASPMIDITNGNDYPSLTVVGFIEASEDDIQELENIKSTVSNYQRKLIDYNTLSLDDIITDANESYATWTQVEIVKYIELISNMGYTEDSNIRSLVSLREDIVNTYSN